MRAIGLTLVMGLATGASSAAEIVSAYTDVDFEKGCSIFSSNEEGGEFANFVCNGFKGYPVIYYTGDLRESVFYGFPPSGDLAPAWESFGGFNRTGPKIEWRVEKDGNREIPFATIHRWFVAADPEDSSKEVEVLVIDKVAQLHEKDGCAVGLVVATGNPKANETARRIADEQARSFVCGADERVVVQGDVPLPDFYRQE
ncbi:MAG: hypothetical protein AB7I79_05540 [Rhizobiaceae bacterium]